MDRCPIVVPVVYHTCIEILDNVLFLITKHHFGVSWAIGVPVFIIESGYLVVNKLVDIGLGDWGPELSAVTGAGLRQFVSFLVPPVPCVCCNPSDFKSHVTGSYPITSSDQMPIARAAHDYQRWLRSSRVAKHA